MNIARFTFSLALLSSVVTPVLAHKDGCSHSCKHESLHPTKATTKSTSSHIEEETDKTKKIEIAEPAIEVAQTIAQPVTVTTVSTPVQATVTPAETAPTIEVAKAAPEILQVAALEIEEAITISEVKEEIIATKELTKEEKKERRLLLADATQEDLQALEDIAALLEEEELSLSLANEVTPEAEVKTAAAPAPEAEEAQDNINNLTQVMI
jgi:hypothetical protein